jgi:hypothetical protein
MTSPICCPQDQFTFQRVNFTVVAACDIFAGVAAHLPERLLEDLVKLMNLSLFGTIGQCAEGANQQTVRR